MNARTWVLLRGWTRDARHWNGFVERLAAAAPGTRVETIDLPGTGRAHGLRSPWTIPRMTQHVRAALRAAGAEPPYAVLAMSMGGMIATDWATRWSAEVEAAVLINTSMRPFSPAWERLRPSAYRALLMAARAPAATSERLILQLTSRSRSDDAELLQEWTGLRLMTPVRRLDAVAQLAAAARFRAPRDNPFRHVLLLTSTRDALVDTRCTLAIGRAWRCEVRTHPFAGHDLPLDDPDWVVANAISVGASNQCGFTVDRSELRASL